MARLLLFTIFALVSGCASLSQPIWFQSTEQLLQEHQYVKALQQTAIEEPNNKQAIKHIQQQATRYRQAKLRQAHNFIQAQQWGRAQQIIHLLIQQVPANKSIDQAQQKLIQKKQEEKRKLETDLAIAQARVLLQDIKLWDFQQRNRTSSWDWFDNQHSLKESRTEQAQQLEHLASQALTKKDYERAKLASKLALSLNNSTHKEALPASNKVNHKKQQQALISQLKTALKNKNFKQVSRLSNILSEPPFKGTALNRLLKKANQTRQQHAAHLDKQADDVYRQGDVDRAIDLWKKAKGIWPKVKGVESKLKRAEKVKLKLDRLRPNKS